MTSTLQEQLSQSVEQTQTVNEALVKQFKDEAGQLQPFNLPEYYNKVRLKINTPAEDLDFMLRQKYGLLPPQLRNSEKLLIKREEQRLAGKR